MPVNPSERPVRATPSKAPRPEPVRRRGDPFFDGLVHTVYDPAVVRSAIHLLLTEQYAEATRISDLRGWGGPQPYGNDRYQFSLEQGPRLFELLPGSDLRRPSQSLLYRVAGAVIYPVHYGDSAYDCPTEARIDPNSDIQNRLAQGIYNETPTLFDPEPYAPPVVVWLLFTGNHVEGGPLSAYLALPGGHLTDNRVQWLCIEELLRTTGQKRGEPEGANDPSGQGPQQLPLPPEPVLPLQLRQ